MSGRIAIVGSRSYPRPDIVEAFVAALPVGTLVVSGGAPGVDSIAEYAARARGLDVTVFQADWDLDEREGSARHAQQWPAAIAVLNARWVRLEDEAAAVRIDEGVTLAAIDLLAGVIAARPASFGGLHALIPSLSRDGCR